MRRLRPRPRTKPRPRLDDWDADESPTLSGRLPDPFNGDAEYKIRSPDEVTAFASRFASEATALLAMTLRSGQERVRISAAGEILRLSLLAPRAQTAADMRKLSDAELDAQLGQYFEEPGGEAWLAGFGFIRAITRAELAKLQAVLDRPRERVA
jgi:hypothetical protein